MENKRTLKKYFIINFWIDWDWKDKITFDTWAKNVKKYIEDLENIQEYISKLLNYYK